MEKKKLVFKIRTTTNNGDSAKSYYTVIDNTLIIRKIMLISNPVDFPVAYRTGHKLIKKFKDKALFQIVFSIQIPTLMQVVETIKNNTK